MAITVATYNAKCEAVSTALASIASYEDVTAARALVLQALAMGAAIPSSQKGNAQLSISISGLQEILRTLRTMEGAYLGVQRQRVAYARPTDGDS